jgi:hypothetical protein
LASSGAGKLIQFQLLADNFSSCTRQKYGYPQASAEQRTKKIFLLHHVRDTSLQVVCENVCRDFLKILLAKKNCRDAISCGLTSC